MEGCFLSFCVFEMHFHNTTVFERYTSEGRYLEWKFIVTVKNHIFSIFVHFCAYRFGNVEDRSKFCLALTWDMYSEALLPIHGQGAFPKLSAQTTEDWPRSGWMNTSSFGFSFSLVSKLHFLLHFCILAGSVINLL